CRTCVLRKSSRSVPWRSKISRATACFVGSPTSNRYTKTLVSKNALTLMKLVARNPSSLTAALSPRRTLQERTYRRLLGGTRPGEALEIVPQDCVHGSPLSHGPQAGAAENLVFNRDGQVSHGEMPSRQRNQCST